MVKTWLYSKNKDTTSVTIEKQLSLISNVSLLRNKKFYLKNFDGLIIVDLRNETKKSAKTLFKRIPLRYSIFSLHSNSNKSSSLGIESICRISERFWVPFNMETFVSKVQLHYRQILYKLIQEKYKNEIELDSLLHTSRIYDKRIKFSPTEFKIFEYLILRESRLVSHYELLTNIKSSQGYLSTFALRQMISRIRKKLSIKDTPCKIRNQYKQGYKLKLYKPNQIAKQLELF